MKTAITGFTLSLSLLITGCTTVDTEKPHTEAYKGEYYDQYEQDEPSSITITINSNDFDFDYPSKPIQSTPPGEITNALADESYQYAMTLKQDNPLGMLETLYTAAAQGSGSAHYELARELTSGVNIEKNADAAINHLRDAVSLHHAEAMRVLGLMNIRGDSMEVDIPAGMALLERAAKHSTRAERELGYLYKGGAYPQIKDTEQALRHLKSAYSKGDTESAYLLGQTYFDNGDYIHAVEPLSFAAGAGHAKAKRLITEIR